MSRALVIIPTYNETENVKSIIPAILTVNAGVEVLVVDDNSPDGTAEVVKQIDPWVSIPMHYQQPGLDSEFPIDKKITNH